MYYIVRGINSFFYTLEFLIVISVFIATLVMYLKKIEKKMFFAYVIAGIINTWIELFIQGLGIRVIQEAFLFNIPIFFPLTPFILGFYEGGIKAIMGYTMVKILYQKKDFHKKFFLILFTTLLSIFITYSTLTSLQFSINNSSLSFTVRELFDWLTILLLIIAFLVSFLYIILNKKMKRKEKISIFYFMLGQVLFMTAFLLPLHLFLIRYIGIQTETNFIPADLFTQISLMYGYFFIFEGIGANIINFPIFYQVDLFEFDD